MGNIIDPKTFLTNLRQKDSQPAVIEHFDSIAVTELNINIKLEVALNEQEFYAYMKKAVSDYNANAAINGVSGKDFDDLHTRYNEYIEALKSLI